MSRASQARRIATAAALGGGGVGAVGAALFGVLVTEVRLARRLIGQPFGTEGLGGEGVYGRHAGPELVVAMLGDSTAVGLGASAPQRTPGVVIARALAAMARRPTRLLVMARVGAESSALNDQVSALLDKVAEPDLVVIMIGANDVTHRRKLTLAVHELERAVRRLRVAGAEVIVGTCPDLGTIEPLPNPLRALARRFSRQLAAAQTIAVIEAGGRTVSLSDMLGPEFAARPREMFSSDRFHPSDAGYARAAAALLPSAAVALGLQRDPERPGRQRGDRTDVVAQAAVRAAQIAGTEVSAADVGGRLRGLGGPWAIVRRRRAARILAEGAGPGKQEPSTPIDSAADPVATVAPIATADSIDTGGSDGDPASGGFDPQLVAHGIGRRVGRRAGRSLVAMATGGSRDSSAGTH